MSAETRDAQILRRMVQYCNEIDETIAVFGDSYEIICKNNVFKNATAMCILQIGELSANLTEDFKVKYNALPWKQIKGMRNLLAHGYGTLDIEEMWNTIKHDIPALCAYCESVLVELAT